MPERLNQPHHGQGVGRLPLVAAGLDHRRARHTLERRIGDLLAQRPNQSGAENVTGCLASNQSEFHIASLARKAAFGRTQ